MVSNTLEQHSFGVLRCVKAYTLFQLGPTLGNNFATLIVTRFFAGLFAAAPLTKRVVT